MRMTSDLTTAGYESRPVSGEYSLEKQSSRTNKGNGRTNLTGQFIAIGLGIASKIEEISDP